MTAPQSPDPSASVNQPQKKSDGWRSLLIYGVILAVFYIGHTQIQTYLGKQALAKVALEPFTFEEALERSASSGKPILADVAAIWCPSCRKLDNQVLSKPDVQQVINDHFIFTRIELESDTGSMAQSRYGLNGVPTLLLLDSKGKKLQQLPLTFDPETFKQILTKIQ